MNSLLLIGLAAGAFYLFSKNKSIEDTVNKELQSVKNELEYQNRVREQDKADNKLTNMCYPCDFTGIVGQYRTTEKYADARWFFKFKNDSDIPLTIIIKSVTVSFMGTAQGYQNDVIFNSTFTIPANGKSQRWELVSSLIGPVFHKNTFGSKLKAQFGLKSIYRFVRAVATVRYVVTNNFNVTAQTAEEVKEVVGEVYFVPFLTTIVEKDPIWKGENDDIIQQYRNDGPSTEPSQSQYR